MGPFTERYLSTTNINGDNLLHLGSEMFGTIPKYTRNMQQILIYRFNTLSIINSDGSGLQVLLDSLEFNYEYFSVSPVDDSIIFSTGPNIYKYYYYTNDLINLTVDQNYYPLLPSYSHDGQKIVYRDSEVKEDTIYVRKLFTMDSDGSNKVKIFEMSGEIMDFLKYPIFLSGIDKIAFFYKGLRICNIDGSEMETFEGFNTSYPVSEGSGKIVFGRSGSVYVFDYSSLKCEVITEGQYPVISPNGEKIAFLDYGLYVINPDGTGREYLHRADGRSLSFSPNSEKIVFWGEKVFNSSKSNPIE